MILDSSAMVAFLLEEPGSDPVIEAMNSGPNFAVGAPTLLETTMVLTNRMGESGRLLLATFLQAKKVDIVSFSEAHWHVAQGAFLRYGKGRHPAALNYGDCMTYAVAYLAGEPLLCIGDDFPQTDLELVDLG